MGILSFFGVNGQTNILTSDLQEKYRNELKQNKKANYKLDFIRISNLKNEIIKKYGFEGVKFLFESKNSANYYQLGELPKDCPWTDLNQKSIKEFIESNFSPIAKKIPNLISTLKSRCNFIYAEKKENTWVLHYLLKIKLKGGRDYFTVYSGGMPHLSPKPNKNLLSYNWDIPKDLKSFYEIHNGFAEINYGDAIGVLDNDSIYVLAKYMKEVSDEINEEPEGYVFEDLLLFYPDGGGNGQCFFKKNSGTTVDWDHETWGISGKIDFFDFVNERLSKIDEE